ncbi:MAG: hypothetical protein OEO77_02335 [Acidimicrobiia bacterium]|nr:hypothetical protein [Acidimicrobiia bacterium]
MLTSINPLGERARRQHYRITVVAYVLGSTVGGALVGLVAATIGWFLPDGDWLVPVVVISLVLGGLVDVRRSRIPCLHRQVDENWLPKYRGWVYGFGFGLQLGTGIATIVTTAAVYTMLILMVGSGSPIIGAGIGALFGFSRALPIISTRSIESHHQLRALMRKVDVGRPWSSRFSAMAQWTAAGLVWVLGA